MFLTLSSSHIVHDLKQEYNYEGSKVYNNIIHHNLQPYEE